MTDFVAETEIEKCELCFTGRRGLLRLSVRVRTFLHEKHCWGAVHRWVCLFLHFIWYPLSLPLSPLVPQTVSRAGQPCSSKCWASTAGLAIARKATATSLCPTHRVAAITWPSAGGPWVPLWSMNCVVSSLEALRSLKIWHFRPYHPLLRWGLGAPKFRTISEWSALKKCKAKCSLFQNLKGKYQRLTLFVKQVTWHGYKIWFSVKNQISNKFWFFKNFNFRAIIWASMASAQSPQVALTSVCSASSNQGIFQLFYLNFVNRKWNWNFRTCRAFLDVRLSKKSARSLIDRFGWDLDLSHALKPNFSKSNRNISSRGSTRHSSVMQVISKFKKP